jgi:hypothetical protein
MDKKKNIEHGLKWGIIIGLVYCLVMFLRYSLGDSNPLLFGVMTIIGYLVVLILLLTCGFARRKQLGGNIDLKGAFQTMFIAVLGFEFINMAFNFIYLKYINPNFFQTMKDSMEELMIKSNVSQDKIDQALNQIDTQASKNISLGTSFLSFAFSIVISGIFALIFALVVKRKRNHQHPFEQQPL